MGYSLRDNIVHYSNMTGSDWRLIIAGVLIWAAPMAILVMGLRAQEDMFAAKRPVDHTLAELMNLMDEDKHGVRRLHAFKSTNSPLPTTLRP